MLALMFYSFIYFTPKPIKSWILKKNIQKKKKVLSIFFISCVSLHSGAKDWKKKNSKYDLINLEPFVFFLNMKRSEKKIKI